MYGIRKTMAEIKFESAENQARVAAINKRIKEDAFLNYIFISKE